MCECVCRAHSHMAVCWQDWTALQLAAEGGHVECIGLLIEAGADVNLARLVRAVDSPLQGMRAD